MSVPPVNRILVAVDLSPCSRAAFDHAARLAAQTHAGVSVLYVHEPAQYAEQHSLLGPTVGGGRWEETRGDALREVEAFLGTDRDTVEEVRVESGFPADVMWDPLESTCRHASLSIL